jgi:hypothetical protein
MKTNTIPSIVFSLSLTFATVLFSPSIARSAPGALQKVCKQIPLKHSTLNLAKIPHSRVIRTAEGWGLPPDERKSQSSNLLLLADGGGTTPKGK